VWRFSILVFGAIPCNYDIKLTEPRNMVWPITKVAPTFRCIFFAKIRKTRISYLTILTRFEQNVCIFCRINSRLTLV